MEAARELLVSAIEEQRPLVLLLGQEAWAEGETKDPILASALVRLGRGGSHEHGWGSLLTAQPLPEGFYDWLAERFERRVHSNALKALGQLPWSAIFTSTLDPTARTLLQSSGRQPEVILTGDETPRATRSQLRPPLYHLFSTAGTHDPAAMPPLDRISLNTRRVGHALPMLNRMLDTATALGVVVVDGVSPGRDWLKVADILGAIGASAAKQILWFGGRPSLSGDDAADFDSAVEAKQIIVEPERLGVVAAELLALGRLADLAPPESGEAGIVTFKNQGKLETTPEERLRVEATTSIVDDSWMSFLPPLGSDARYAAFRKFHGDLGGPRLLVEGVRRGFSIERDFERSLISQVFSALGDHASVDGPIVVHGQSATGKSVALARLVARVREEKSAAVLYSIGRVPSSQDVSGFCEAAERAGAQATLIVCDANLGIDSYRDLLLSLRSRGRRVVVVGSRYRLTDGTEQGAKHRVEAPSGLSKSEQQKLAELVKTQLAEEVKSAVFANSHVLAALYRVLPPSRTRIAYGLAAEARSVSSALLERGRELRPAQSETLLAMKLRAAGAADTHRPLFDDRQNDVIEASDAASRVVDLVMVAGCLNCDVPVNLLLRAVGSAFPALDVSSVADLFRGLDLFRWKWADRERSELLVLPRLTLEAEMICRTRMGGADKEGERLLELISSIRPGVDATHERRFLLNLLQQVGDDGPRGLRYARSYVEIARQLTRMRLQYGVIHPSIMLQEAAFRRIAVREDMAPGSQRIELLEEARDAVQTAIDGIRRGDISASRRTVTNLHVERASLYGFLANDRAKRHASSDDVWSSYQAARVAIRQAASISDTYFPLDVGLWTPADLLKLTVLNANQRAELTADIYSTIDQVDPAALPPKQRDKFDRRRMILGPVLKDSKLTDDAYRNLEESGSTAGYFLRARSLAPPFAEPDADFSTLSARAQAREAADFLNSLFSKIERDERCLGLLLECRWIAEMGARLLRGQRQPLPHDVAIAREILVVVRALNHAAGESTRHTTRYLEAVLTWLVGEEQPALEMFKSLSQDTEFEDPGRVVRRHLVSDQQLKAARFSGRVEKQKSDGHWFVRVDDLRMTVDLLNRDFPSEQISYGRTISGFAIAFNFIGPIADAGRRS